MNKKNYIQPLTNVVNVQLSTLLTGSNPDYTPEENFNNEELVGARQHNNSIWDEEEEY